MRRDARGPRHPNARAAHPDFRAGPEAGAEAREVRKRRESGHRASRALSRALSRAPAQGSSSLRNQPVLLVGLLLSRPTSDMRNMNDYCVFITTKPARSSCWASFPQPQRQTCSTWRPEVSESRADFEVGAGLILRLVVERVEFRVEFRQT